MAGRPHFPSRISGDGLIRELVSLRVKTGTSREELAETTGLYVSAIARMERGLTAIKYPNLVAIANALGYDVCLVPRSSFSAIEDRVTPGDGIIPPSSSGDFSPLITSGAA